MLYPNGITNTTDLLNAARDAACPADSQASASCTIRLVDPNAPANTYYNGRRSRRSLYELLVPSSRRVTLIVQRTATFDPANVSSVPLRTLLDAAVTSVPTVPVSAVESMLFAVSVTLKVRTAEGAQTPPITPDDLTTSVASTLAIPVDMLTVQVAQRYPTPPPPRAPPSPFEPPPAWPTPFPGRPPVPPLVLTTSSIVTEVKGESWTAVAAGILVILCSCTCLGVRQLRRRSHRLKGTPAQVLPPLPPRWRTRIIKPTSLIEEMWFYGDPRGAAKRSKHGPVSQETLLQLRAAGSIDDGTMVFTASMERWAPFGEVFERAQQQTGPALTAVTSAMETTAVVEMTATSDHADGGGGGGGGATTDDNEVEVDAERNGAGLDLGGATRAGASPGAGAPPGATATSSSPLPARPADAWDVDDVDELDELGDEQAAMEDVESPSPRHVSPK